MPLPLYFPRRAGQQLHAFRLSFADWVDRYRKKRAEEKALSLSLKDIEDEDNKKKMQVGGGWRGVRGGGVSRFSPLRCLYAVLLFCCAVRLGGAGQAQAEPVEGRQPHEVRPSRARPAPAP